MTTALQVLRIPVLLLLIRVTARPMEDLREGMGRLQVGDVWGPWLTLAGIGLAFVLVTLVGRRRRHPWVVLGAEVLVAGAVALIPPVQWVLWFGLGAWSSAMVGGFAQPLSMAWLGIGVATAYHQRRGKVPDPAAPSRPRRMSDEA